MATIVQHGKGFRVQWKEGRTVHRGPTLPSREAADLWMAENMPAARATTLMQFVDLWREAEPSTHRSIAAQRVGKIIVSRAWSDPRRLTKADLDAWRRADEGWRRPAQYLLTILRWASTTHGVPIRPEVLKWKPPAAPRRAPAALLTDAQAQAIRECAVSMGPRAGALIDYLLTYGARPITACRLQVQHLDTTRCELELPNEKHSGGWRHLITAEHLDTWANLPRPAVPPGGDPGTLPLFPHYKEDRPWRIQDGSAKELASWFKNTIGKRLKLGKHAGIYSLKRYAITRLLRLTNDPATVAGFTGHMDMSQVLTYARTNADRQAEALAALSAVGPKEGPRVPASST